MPFSCLLTSIIFYEKSPVIHITVFLHVICHFYLVVLIIFFFLVVGSLILMYAGIFCLSCLWFTELPASAHFHLILHLGDFQPLFLWNFFLFHSLSFLIMGFQLYLCICLDLWFLQHITYDCSVFSLLFFPLFFGLDNCHWSSSVMTLLASPLAQL